MSHQQPQMGERTRGRVVYGDRETLTDEVFTIVALFDGTVTMEDERSGELFELSPAAARELAQELNRAARAAS